MSISPTTPSPGQAPGSLLTYTSVLMTKCGMAATKQFTEALEPLGLRPKHWGALMMMDADGPLSQQALGERLKIDPSNMVALVDDLERAGLAERRRDARDRRRYGVHLTEAGREILARSHRAAEEVEDRIFSVLDDSERRELHELLLRVATSGNVLPPHGLAGDCPPGAKG